ncbi:hypothetical protein FXO38_21708 [Capsicum annuum]|nr:hypothetical protein FXO38_21708 [Capsicum annuum]
MGVVLELVEGGLRAHTKDALKIILAAYGKVINSSGIIGINDHVYPGVRNSIALCRSAGANVRMVIGDNINTATTIAREYGILTNVEKSIPKGYCIREAEEGVIDDFWVDVTVVTHRVGDHPYAVQEVAGGKSFMVKELEESFQLIGGGQFLDLTEAGCLGIIQICIRLYDGLVGVHKFHPQSSIESLFDGLRIDDDRRHRKPTSFLVSPMDTLAEDRRAKVL